LPWRKCRQVEWNILQGGQAKSFRGYRNSWSRNRKSSDRQNYRTTVANSELETIEWNSDWSDERINILSLIYEDLYSVLLTNSAIFIIFCTIIL
jgi:hypothetical protein